MTTHKSAAATPIRELLLASASPRRQELLRQIGVVFRLANHGIEELRLEGETPVAFVTRMAREKACSVLNRTTADQQPVVLGADTIVVCDQQILGKPAGRKDAQRMLMLLSDREHLVLSAVAIANHQGLEVSVSQTLVEFIELDKPQIDEYWRTGEPRDKAGAYAIQGLGGIFVKQLKGSYTGVVGLPLFETTLLLRKFSINYWQQLVPEIDQ